MCCLFVVIPVKRWIFVSSILITAALQCHQTMHGVVIEKNSLTSSQLKTTFARMRVLNQRNQPPHGTPNTSCFHFSSTYTCPIARCRHSSRHVFQTLFNGNNTHSQFLSNEMCRHRALRGVPGTPTARQECDSSLPTQGVNETLLGVLRHDPTSWT